MDWDAIGAIGEVLGGLAVILSLLYVGRQIKTSSNIALATSQRELNKEWNDILGLVASNEQLAAVWATGFTDFDKLTETEQVQFGHLMNQIMAHHANALRMHHKGLIDADLLASVDASTLGVLKTTGGGKWWNQFGQFFPEPHQNYVSSLLHHE